MLFLLRKPVGFSDECLHMLPASHMRAAGRKQGRSCSQRCFLHAAPVSGALWFACVRPNSHSIKTLPPFHKLPCLLKLLLIQLNNAFNVNGFVLIIFWNSDWKPLAFRSVWGKYVCISLWCDKLLPIAGYSLDHFSGTSCCPDLCIWHLFFIHAHGSIHNSSWHTQWYHRVTAIFKMYSNY